MIKAIIFDFHGVLGFKKENYSVSEIAKEIDEEIGKVTNDQKFEENVKQKYKLSEAEFQKVLSEIIDRYEPFPELWQMLPPLKNKYKLGIINNGTYLTVPGFKKNFPIEKYFDVFISSALEGIRKPDREIYLLAAKALNVEPEECLYFDDSEENVTGAINAGMKAYFWQNKEDGFTEFCQIIAKIEDPKC